MFRPLAQAVANRVLTGFSAAGAIVKLETNDPLSAPGAGRGCFTSTRSEVTGIIADGPRGSLFWVVAALPLFEKTAEAAFCGLRRFYGCSSSP
jgi:hypothetical protein